jgi:preprotein translocase subunit SecG
VSSKPTIEFLSELCVIMAALFLAASLARAALSDTGQSLENVTDNMFNEIRVLQSSM